MNTILYVTGIFCCIMLMLRVTHSYTVLGKENDDEHHVLIGRPLALSHGRLLPIYQDQESMMFNSEEDDDHEFEKRRFNAWAGKRSVAGKRRFNAWAGRR